MRTSGGIGCCCAPREQEINAVPAMTKALSHGDLMELILPAHPLLALQHRLQGLLLLSRQMV